MDSMVPMFTVKLIPKNLDNQFWGKIETAIQIVGKLNSKEFYKKCYDFKKSGFLDLGTRANLELEIEEINIGDHDFFISEIGQILLLTVGYYLRNKDNKRFLTYTKNRFVDINTLRELQYENNIELLEDIREIFWSDNEAVLTSASFMPNNDDTYFLKGDLDCKIGLIQDETRLNKKLKEYLRIAEKITEEKHFEYYEFPFIPLSLSENSNSILLLSIINDWIKSIVNYELKKIKDFHFEYNIGVAQNTFFTKKENPELFDLAQYFSNSNNTSLYLKKIIHESLKYLSIGKSVDFEKHLYGDAYMIFIKDNSNRKINFGSLGSGHFFVVRLLLLITYKICRRAEMLGSKLNRQGVEEEESDYPITIIITEPESNLHPDLQSKLCDLISRLSVKYHINFLIETHSEYFLRGLQVSVAKKVINHNMVSLYYFQNLNNEGTTIRRIKMDANGFFLDKFGTGFLDESQLAIEKLFKVKEN